MIDWTGVFEREVAPILASFAAPIPTPVLVVASLFLLVGLALLGLLSFPRNLSGLLPISLVLFGGVMVGQGRSASTGEVVVREGTVVEKSVEKVLRTDVSSGASVGELVYSVRLDLQRQGVLTAEGVQLEPAAGEPVTLTTSETLYAALEQGETVLGISLPTGPEYLHLRVAPDGTVTR